MFFADTAAFLAFSVVSLSFFDPPRLSVRYGMRFISKVLKDSLHEKFPDATEDELLKVCIQTDEISKESR